MRSLGIQALEGARMKWFLRTRLHGTLVIRRDRGRLKGCDVSFWIPNADHMPRMTAAFDLRCPALPSRSFPTAHVNRLRGKCLSVDPQHPHHIPFPHTDPLPHTIAHAPSPQRRSRRPARRPVLRIQRAHAPRRPAPCSVSSPPAVGAGPEPSPSRRRDEVRWEGAAARRAAASRNLARLRQKRSAEAAAAELASA